MNVRRALADVIEHRHSFRERVGAANAIVLAIGVPEGCAGQFCGEPTR
jgi:hypothetical protein